MKQRILGDGLEVSAIDEALARLPHSAVFGGYLFARDAEIMG